MKYLYKVSLSQSAMRMAMIKITALGTVVLTGVVLAIFNIVIGKPVFALVYLLGAILGAAYVVMVINSALPTGIEADSENLYISIWDNELFPYDINSRFVALREFVPAKVKSYSVPIKEISALAVGTSGYLLRVLENPDYARKYEEISKISSRIAASLKRNDILLLELKNGESCIMSVSGFDAKGLNDIISLIEHTVTSFSFKTNLKSLKKLREV